MRFLRLAALLAAFTFLTVSPLVGQDKGAPPKSRGQLPANWKSLGITDDQKTELYEIQGRYGVKIDELKKQITEQTEKMKKEEEALLTDAQKARLREIMASKAPAEDKKDKK